MAPSPVQIRPRAYTSMLLKELKSECRSRGIFVTGNKAELAARLECYDRITAENQSELHQSIYVQALCVLLEIMAHFCAEAAIYLFNIIVGWAIKFAVFEAFIASFTLSREELLWLSVATNTLIQYAWFINAGSIIRRCIIKGVYMYIVEAWEETARN